ncbi:hypothetical protein LshimejAT787_0900470 [Lyophyllum shimeji]|uniref:Uncharacterized protein n=1 Tax=Lyophyllum shimeji TaxID=47721 RepID=A0A9P3PT24_LYOSH|nr:hypothetical protein LshimejAT787_0900470 [Lyophyllum shimeji]
MWRWGVGKTDRDVSGRYGVTQSHHSRKVCVQILLLTATLPRLIQIGAPARNLLACFTASRTLLFYFKAIIQFEQGGFHPTFYAFPIYCGDRPHNHRIRLTFAAHRCRI